MGCGSNTVTDMSWMDEVMIDYPPSRMFYKFCKYIFRKKLTYKKMFMLLYGINRKALGERKAEEEAFKKIVQAYKENNGRNPEGI